MIIISISEACVVVLPCAASVNMSAHRIGYELIKPDNSLDAKCIVNWD